MSRSSKFTITDTTLDDVPAVAAMHAQSWIDTYPNAQADISREWVERRVKTRTLSPEAIEKRRNWIKDNKHSKNSMNKVAKNENGEIIGMISPFREDGVQRVGAIYVRKDYYGTGVAQALMDEIIKWADSDNPLRLNVATYNQRAKAFYRKYGFKEVPGSEHIEADKIPVIDMIREDDNDEI